eukprot:1808854-Pleurochrysis_carterae.AAC.1
MHVDGVLFCVQAFPKEQTATRGYGLVSRSAAREGEIRARDDGGGPSLALSWKLPESRVELSMKLRCDFSKVAWKLRASSVQVQDVSTSMSGSLIKGWPPKDFGSRLHLALSLPTQRGSHTFFPSARPQSARR